MSADVTKAPWHAKPTSRSSSIRRKKHRNFAAATKNLRDRSYRVRHSLIATKLLPMQKETAVLANKIRHTNLQRFLDSFTAIFTTNSPVYVSEAARTRFASLVKWTGLDGQWIEPQSGTFQTRPDRTWGPPSYLYNGYRVFSGRKAAEAWCWPPTPFCAPKLKKG
jgi:hypothetical protein